MRRILLTGASGFIGQHCLRLLLADADNEVHAVNRQGPGLDIDGRVRWHAVDLRDASKAAQLVADLRPSHILHGAWIATPGAYGRSPENMDWLVSSLAMARAFGEGGGERFVGVGTSAEYLPNDAPCVEDVTPVQPTTVYGKCKAASWLGLQAASQHHGFSAAWGRVFLPYGPGDAPQRLIPSLLATLRRGQPIETTHGRQLRDFIFAPDVADLLVRLLFTDEPGAFNVGTGQATQVRWVIETLAEQVHAAPDLLRFGAREFPSSEPIWLVADMEKVRRKLSWEPSTSIAAGLSWVLNQPSD